MTQTTPAESAPQTSPAPQAAPQAAPSTPTQSSGDSGNWMDSLDKAFAALEQAEPEKVPKKGTDEVPKKGTDPKAEAKTEAKAETPTEPKTEAKTDGEDPEVKSMTPAAGARFKELKGEVKEWKAKVAELERKIAEAKPAAPDLDALPEVQALKARLDEQERELALTRVEATQEYKQSVLEPLNQVLGLAGGLAEKYQVDGDALNRALAETDVDKQSDQLQDLAVGFSERDRINLYRLADDIGVILRRREDIQANAKSAYETRQQKEAAEKAAQDGTLKQSRDAALGEVYKVIESKVALLSDKTISEDVKARVAKTDIFNASPDVQAYAAYSGALLPHVLKANKAQEARIAELEKVITGFRNTVPRAGGGKLEASEVAGDVGFLEAVEKNWG
jgi:hypothetical protein